MEYTFNTGNQVGDNGSADARDLVDNAQVADRLITSTELTVPDRLGVTRRTWNGIQQAVVNYVNRGEWVTATAYNVNDIWRDGPSGAFYLVLADYTSGASAAADIAGGNVVVHQPKDWVSTVTSVAEAQALAGFAPGQSVNLVDGGRSGVFDVVAGDFTAQVAADTLNGIYIAMADDPTGASKCLVRRLNGFVTPEMFGGVADGNLSNVAAGTDSTAAISAALAFCDDTGLELIYSGVFVYNGSGESLTSTSMYQRGIGKETSGIAIRSSAYLIEHSADMLGCEFSSFGVSGGLGFYRNLRTTVNVSNKKSFIDINFLDYTRCAVETNHVDSPHWNFDLCRFKAASSVGTIGAAISGTADMTVFFRCAFELNQIHAKCGRAGQAMTFKACNFLQFNSTGVGSTVRVNIWLVPHTAANNSGDGAMIDGCAMTNENQLSTDLRIVIADESAGTSFGDKMPNLSSASSNYATGITVSDTKMTGSHNIPIVFTTTPNIRDVVCNNPVITGTSPSYLIEYLPAVTVSNDRIRNKHILKMGPSSESGVNVPPFPVSNKSVLVAVDDPLHVESYSGGGAVSNNAASAFDKSGFEIAASTAISAYTLSGSTKVADITDSSGGSNAATITLTGTLSGVAYTNFTSKKADTVAWVSVDVRLPSTVVNAEMTDLVVQVGTSSGAINARRYVNLSSDWKRISFPFILTETTSTWRLFFYSGSGTSEVDIGRPLVHYGAAAESYSSIFGIEASAADIANAASGVNTVAKWNGKTVWDTTNNRTMRASGASATSAWYVVDGSVSVTPA